MLAVEGRLFPRDRRADGRVLSGVSAILEVAEQRALAGSEDAEQRAEERASRAHGDHAQPRPPRLRSGAGVARPGRSRAGMRRRISAPGERPGEDLQEHLRRARAGGPARAARPPARAATARTEAAPTQPCEQRCDRRVTRSAGGPQVERVDAPAPGPGVQLAQRGLGGVRPGRRAVGSSALEPGVDGPPLGPASVEPLAGGSRRRRRRRRARDRARRRGRRRCRPPSRRPTT